MEKNQNKKPKNSAIYIISVVMLITVLVIAVISAIGTANRTEDKVGIDTDEAVITGKKTTDKKDTKSTDKTTKETKETKDSETGDTKKADQSSEAAAPLEFCLPVNGYISKDYSMDMPVFSLTMNDYRTHSGLDIQASVGAAVATVAEGEVTKRYTDPFMGVCVEVSHGGGLVSKYMNLGEEFPKDTEVGCKVYGGQTIGCIGESAAVEAADTSHLHFELLQDGKHVDPLDYISYEPMEDGYTE